MTLSKSDYMLYLKHPAWLWLKKFQKHTLPEYDENTRALFAAGHEFEEYAEQLFPHGMKLGFDSYAEYLTLPLRTLEAIRDGADTIFQGRFEAEGITCIVDVIKRNGEPDTFDLIEIKASTKVKPYYLYDLAFQVLTLEKSGINVGKIFVVFVNNDYVRDGDIDPDGITSQEDVTDEVRELLTITEEQIKEAFSILEPGECPDLSPRYVNRLGIARTRWFQEWLDIYKHLHPNLDPYCIYYLSYPNAEQIGQLEDEGITQIADVPEELALRDKQRFQIRCTCNETRIVKKDKIKDFIDSLEYPLYFFDYETHSSLIPAFDGCKPYKDYPFQYSLHILEEPGGEIRHEEYLHAESSNPMQKLLEKLKRDIGDSGTVLTWNMRYEKSCNQRMAECYPEYKAFLEDLNDRIDDLMKPFSEMWFVDKDYFGSASVKYVLPVLVPELNHSDLEVSDGLHARRLWTDTVLNGENGYDRDRILKDLSDYCTLDTYAMVKILEVLEVTISSSSSEL